MNDTVTGHRVYAGQENKGKQYYGANATRFAFKQEYKECEQNINGMINMSGWVTWLWDE